MYLFNLKIFASSLLSCVRRALRCSELRLLIKKVSYFQFVVCLQILQICPTKYTQEDVPRVRTLHTWQENPFRRETEARAYHLSQCITREELASLIFPKNIFSLVFCGFSSHLLFHLRST